MKSKNDFEYKYVAPTSEERKEIESIRKSYTQKPNINKLYYLRKLDYKVKNIPAIIGLIMGIVVLLIFGTGITMVLEWSIVIFGVIVGIIGISVMAIVYPVFLKISKYLKDKYSDEIIKLSEELLNDENK